ncbi:MAG: SDR family NAD(P)-dependent oxidoreductase [Bacteroidales bacterium]|nr:SDR family NAD(P)-dependent oxidoreductase [Bacteroidales bacterium]
MEKNVCLVTGANSGIGYELAKGMAQKNYQVILLCRNLSAGQLAREKIIVSTKNPDIDLIIADLCSQESIREFANQFNAKYEHLDILFNNAGANFFDRQINEDNIEMTFSVNYLAPFLMTNLLLPKLKLSKSARIITTMGHINGKDGINFNDINFEKGYNVIKVTSHAILAKYLFTTELSRRLKDTNITTNCFFPGATKTELQKKMPPLFRMITAMMRPFFQNAKKGAEPGLFLATSDKMISISGKFYKRYKETSVNGLSNDLEMAKRLWNLSENLTKIKTN